jgi:hypothetical protein
MGKRVLLALGVVVIVAMPAYAQTIKKSTVTGRIVSRGAVVVGVGSVPLGFGPVCGALNPVLTQACIDNNGGLSNLVAPLVPIIGNGPATGNCTVFTPGIAINPGDDFVCVNTLGGTVRCTITGVCLK